MRGAYRRLKTAWFKAIRPLFEQDVDPNEEFVCGECCEPVLRRVLFCSVACSDRFEAKYGEFL
jgi:hypothetical protein